MKGALCIDKIRKEGLIFEIESMVSENDECTIGIQRLLV
jgi:hypothetical protein